MNTYIPSAGSIERKWYLVDADGMTLGRLASEVAKVLSGKNKPEYTPFLDCGDNVVIINAAKVKLTGRKADQKVYFHHAYRPGSQTFTTYREAIAKKPCWVVEHAVKGMLPSSNLGRKMGLKLYIYEGSEYKQVAQKPEELKF